VIELENRDPEGYRRGRHLEAKYDAELALKFLEEGLYRNAAGKAFQAWKALLAALAVEYRDKLAERFKGVRLEIGAGLTWRISWWRLCPRATCSPWPKTWEKLQV